MYQITARPIAGNTANVEEGDWERRPEEVLGLLDTAGLLQADGWIKAITNWGLEVGWCLADRQTDKLGCPRVSQQA
ncbi:hypothetical protein DPEC_G00283060 [Dallia pectoralis]|uniref:Uncharacterized protein n=1 Tax=Dallia pectoralis TaxID=75939 RepID=A0ACC2FJ45_DALPE|nr:hypothetical protein DPEC_G00283060 [Dallia pectoralis]